MVSEGTTVGVMVMVTGTRVADSQFVASFTLPTYQVVDDVGATSPVIVPPPSVDC